MKVLLRRIAQLPVYLFSFINHARRNGLTAAIVMAYQYMIWGFGHGYGGSFRRWFARSGMDAQTAPASVVFAKPSVLIVGPLDLPQCRKYRVVQKLELLQDRGVDCHMSHVDDQVRVYDLLQTATHLLFYRAASSPVVDGYLAEAQRLGVALAYDIDDPIFDAETYRANRNLETLSTDERELLLASAALHLNVMRECQYHFVSTTGMATRVEAVLNSKASIWPNGIDAETLQIAAPLQTRPAAKQEETVVAYMSGSRAHDRDFESVAPVLAEILEEHANAVLLLVGYVDVPSCLKAFDDRLRRVPFGNYHEYFTALASAHIAVIPLLIDNFNECKSAIRFFEASLLNIPVVASRVGQFQEVIEPGQTGFLASDAAEWCDALNALLVDPDLRHRIGSAARTSVVEHHTIAAITPRVLPALAEIGVECAS
ncbi:MAG: glycosyltransferase family 4 protein [Pseudomonadota bacterium]